PPRRIPRRCRRTPTRSRSSAISSESVVMADVRRPALPAAAVGAGADDLRPAALSRDDLQPEDLLRHPEDRDGDNVAGAAVDDPPAVEEHLDPDDLRAAGVVELELELARVDAGHGRDRGTGRQPAGV